MSERLGSYTALSDPLHHQCDAMLKHIAGAPEALEAIMLQAMPAEKVGPASDLLAWTSDPHRTDTHQLSCMCSSDEPPQEQASLAALHIT